MARIVRCRACSTSSLRPAGQESDHLGIGAAFTTSSPSGGLDDHAHHALVKGDFIVTGPDVGPMKFKSRREAKDWCKAHHPGSSITEVGPGGKRAAPKKLSERPS